MNLSTLTVLVPLLFRGVKQLCVALVWIWVALFIEYILVTVR